MEEIKNKVANTIQKLSSLFGSATLLAGVVEQFGLFEGQVEMNTESEWVFTQTDEQHCYSRAEQGWAFPTFASYVDGDQWSCPIGFGRHWVCLVFNINTGELEEVYPDDTPSERCWGTDDYQSRVAQVLAAIK